MAKKNKLQETIDTFCKLLKKEKSSYSKECYKKHIVNAIKLLQLIKNGKMTPEIFNKLPARDKWDIADSKLLKNIVWCCNKCGFSQGKTPPQASVFAGDSTHCSKCDNMLTCRTGGGQNNPFNMTFKKIK